MKQIEINNGQHRKWLKLQNKLRKEEGRYISTNELFDRLLKGVE